MNMKWRFQRVQAVSGAYLMPGVPSDILNHTPIAHGAFVMDHDLKRREHGQNFILRQRSKIRWGWPFIAAPHQTALTN